MLTKNDIKAIRDANDICIHLNARHPEGLVRLMKRKPYNAKPFETDQEYVLTANVRMETSDKPETVECFSMIGLYHNQRSPSSSIFKTLRIGDEVTFSFYPDAHSNGYVAMADLHADVLYMHVTRNDKRQTWELDISITPSNSARMCKGVPNSASYEGAAAERRRLTA